MNEDMNVLLRQKQKLRQERDMAMQSMLKKHFEKMRVLQSSEVDMAAQTSAIVSRIRKMALTMIAAKVEEVEASAQGRRSEEMTPRDVLKVVTENDENSENHESNLNEEKSGKEGVEKDMEEEKTAGDIKKEVNEAISSQMTDDDFLSEDLRKLVVAMDNQLEEYSKVLRIPSNYSAKFKDSLKECNHAADQLQQQIKIIEDRSLENSKNYFDSLSDDEHRGGTARLVRSIAINVQSVEDSTRKLQADITTSRKEFLKLSDMNGLMEVAPHHSYEKARDAFAHIRRVSEKKSDESNKKWMQFEKKCREKQLAEMRKIYDMYVGSSDPTIIQAANEEGIQSFENKLQAHRNHVNNKLREFNNKIINISNNNIDKITNDADVLISWRNKIIPWELEEQKQMEASLTECVDAIENKYIAVVEDLRDHHTQVLSQIDGLRFHQQKLTHLSKVSAKKRRSLRDRSAKIQSKSILPLKTATSSRPDVKSSGNLMELIEIPDTSMRLGRRTVDFGRLVSIDNEECLSLLTHMLHDVNPDPMILKRLNHYTAHYSKLAKMKKINSTSKY